MFCLPRVIYSMRVSLCSLSICVCGAACVYRPWWLACSKELCEDTGYSWDQHIYRFSQKHSPVAQLCWSKYSFHCHTLFLLLFLNLSCNSLEFCYIGWFQMLTDRKGFELSAEAKKKGFNIALFGVGNKTYVAAHLLLPPPLPKKRKQTFALW